MGSDSSKDKDPDEDELTADFLSMVQLAQDEPEKLAVLEISASLHVYTRILLDGSGFCTVAFHLLQLTVCKFFIS